MDPRDPDFFEEDEPLDYLLAKWKTGEPVEIVDPPSSNVASRSISFFGPSFVVEAEVFPVRLNDAGGVSITEGRIFAVPQSSS